MPQAFWAAFEDDDETMTSVLCAIPFSSRFDGHDVPMFGIGDVCTLPMYRRRGGIRAIFKKALLEMYEQGGVFSYLYPFSSAFCRQFGYELGCERQNRGMLRMVNVREALRLATSRESGELVLEVRDAQIAANNGCFRVRMNGGRTIEVADTAAAPDVRLSISALAPLLLGRYDVSAIPYMSDVELLCAPERASALFFHKPHYITRPF